MQILIVDDEPRSAQLLKILVEKFYQNQAEISLANTAKEALDFVTLHSPGLLLLDIELNGRSAFDLLDKMPDRDFPLIITSASREFAFKAFEYGSCGYVLKPINPDDLFSALKRISSFPPVIQPNPPDGHPTLPHTHR